MRIVKEIKRWFPILGDPDDTELLIRALTPGELAEIASKTQRTHFSDGHASVEIDHALDGMLTAEKCIAGWKKVFDDDEPMEYNRKNLRRVLAEVPGFALLAAEFHRQLTAKTDEIEEELEKD